MSSVWVKARIKAVQDAPEYNGRELWADLNSIEVTGVTQYGGENKADAIRKDIQLVINVNVRHPSGPLLAPSLGALEFLPELATEVQEITLKEFMEAI